MCSSGKAHLNFSLVLYLTTSFHCSTMGDYVASSIFRGILVDARVSYFRELLCLFPCFRTDILSSQQRASLGCDVQERLADLSHRLKVLGSIPKSRQQSVKGR